MDSGTYYTGYFKDNVAHGYGKLCMPNQYKEEGLFFEDSFLGEPDEHNREKFDDKSIT